MTEFVKDKDCLVCGPGVLIELDTTVTLQKVQVSAFYRAQFIVFLISTLVHCFT